VAPKVDILTLLQIAIITQNDIIQATNCQLLSNNQNANTNH